VTPVTAQRATPAVTVEHLTKDYLLGDGSRGYSTFREAVIQTVTAPVRAVTRRGRRMRESERAGRTFRALNDVSFVVSPGENVAIVGRNGAGKSTILKVLSRITEPTSGRIATRGRVASLLEVGTGFHPELTGRENVYLNGSLLGMRRREIERKFDAIVDFAEIEQFLDTPVKRYSSGMYVRLAFAVAAHVEPDILIVDEVLAVGDAAFQQKCLGKMQEAGAGNRTVLFVSHNMAAVTRLCPRALLLRRGQLVFDGTARDAARLYLGDGGEGAAPRRDLSGMRRRIDTWGEAMRLATIEFRPHDGPSFKYREPLRFRIEFTALAERERVGVGIGIDDLTGTRLVTCNSEAIGVTVTTRRGTRYTFDLTVPVSCLKPGGYGLSCAVLTGDHLYDFVSPATSFDIAPIDVETGAAVAAGEGSGPIAVPSSWTVAQRVVSPEPVAAPT
jgi:lipopolysaccharide transport system ATP-binding protein